MTDKHSASRVQLLEIGREHEAQRIDNFLLRLLKGVPKSHVYQLLRTGQVRVNGSRVQARYKLQPGDNLRVPPVRYRPPVQNDNNWSPPGALCERLQQSIIYRDNDIFVLDKPAGLAVHGGSGLRYGLIEVLQHHFQDRGLQLVHRLDRETSGCLLVARNARALKALHGAFIRGQVEKRYLALTRGHWDFGERRVSAAVKKQAQQSGRRLVTVSEDGKSACSVFKPVIILPAASLVEVLLDTGRTHQVRVHAAHLDAPLAGDDKYGDRGFNRRMAKLGLSRLFLHAHSISFALGGRQISVSAPLPDELSKVLDNLKHHDSNLREQ